MKLTTLQQNMLTRYIDLHRLTNNEIKTIEYILNLNIKPYQREFGYLYGVKTKDGFEWVIEGEVPIKNRYETSFGRFITMMLINR